MKTSLAKIVAANSAIDDLMSISLPVSAAYQLSRILSVVRDEFKTYNDTREETLKKYAKKDESGNPILEDIKNDKDEVVGKKYVLSDDDIKTIDAELKEVLEKEITIAIDPIEIKDLGDAKVKPSTLSELTWIFA